MKLVNNLVINKECLYISFFYCRLLIDFSLKVFIQQPLINYIFGFIVEFLSKKCRFFVDFSLKVFIQQPSTNYIFNLIVEFLSILSKKCRFFVDFSLKVFI